jgi:transglutaminase-like putative cysteine protease
LDVQIANLTEFVHRHLDYRVDVNVMGVLDSLEKRVGDCTEFADLLTTLARAAGLPARTVTGLAYAETEGPGFYLHAWTEIAIYGTWHPVDPTFGQTRIGPAHIRFPDSDSAYLRAYAAIPEMRFRVTRAVYRDRLTGQTP